MGIPVETSQVSGCVRNPVFWVHILEPWTVPWEWLVSCLGTFSTAGRALSSLRMVRHLHYLRSNSTFAWGEAGGIDLNSFVEIFQPGLGKEELWGTAALHLQGWLQRSQDFRCSPRNWANLGSRWILYLMAVINSSFTWCKKKVGVARVYEASKHGLKKKKEKEKRGNTLIGHGQNSPQHTK